MSNTGRINLDIIRCAMDEAIKGIERSETLSEEEFQEIRLAWANIGVALVDKVNVQFDTTINEEETAETDQDAYNRAMDLLLKK